MSCKDVFRMFEGYYGPYFTPSVDADGNLTWTNNAGLPNPVTINIKGEPGAGLQISGIVATTADLPATADDWTFYLVGTEAPYTVCTYDPNSGWINLGNFASGPKGDPGAVFTPSVSAAGVISWTNDGDLPNPEPVDIKGDIGATPAFSIGTVTTGAAGSSAAATITGTDEAPVLNLTIPQGLKGDAGNGDMLAPSFSTSTAYAAGDYVIYNGSLYCFTADHAAGAWTGTDAVAAKLAEDVADVKSDIDTAESYYFPNGSDQLLDALHATVENWYINSSTLKIKGNATCRSVIIPVDPNINAKVTLTKAYDSQFMIGQLNTTTPIVEGDVIRTDSVASYIHTITVELDSSTRALLVWYWYNNAADPDDVLQSMMVAYGEEALPFAPYRTIYHYDQYEEALHISTGEAGSVEKTVTATGTAVLSAVADLIDFDTASYPVKVCVSGKNMCYPWLNARDNVHEITSSGVTIVDNGDGGFAISGTATGTALMILCKIPYLPKGTYICNGTDFGLDEGRARIDIRAGSSGATLIAQGNSDNGFTFTIDTDTPDLNVCMRIGRGNTVNTTVYPMVRNSAVADNTFGIYYPVQHIEAGGKSDVLSLSCYETTVITVTDTSGTDVDFLTVHRANLKTYIDKTVIGNRLFVAGDSITSGYPTYTIRWYEAVQKKYHYVVGGVRQVGAGFSFYNGVNACKIAMQTDFTQYDIAVFAFGTNDYGNNIPLGTINDSYTYSEDSSQTFYACVKYVVEKALTDNPKLILVFSLPINRSREGAFGTNYAFGTANAENFTLKDYCDAIVAVCEKYGIPYISHFQSAFNAYTLPSLLTDGLHPNEDGYRMLSQEMIAKLGAVVQPYQTM